MYYVCMYNINADSVHCIIWDQILYAKRDYKWHNALFLWLGCLRLNAALLIHFNDIILENKNKYWQKRGVIPLCKFCNNFFNLFSVFLPERLYKQLIFFGPYPWFFTEYYWEMNNIRWISHNSHSQWSIYHATNLLFSFDCKIHENYFFLAFSIAYYSVAQTYTYILVYLCLYQFNEFQRALFKPCPLWTSGKSMNF